MKTISIIIPVYRVEQYLRQCVDSVLAQSYQHFEIVLVDDGSPDDCPRMCDEYADKDPRIKVVHKQNGGLSDARNKGIEAATGDYLLFMDSDDYWDDTDALAECMRLCEDTNADVTIFGFKKYYEDTGVFETVRMDIPPHLCRDCQPIERLLRDNVFTTSACNKIVRSSMFRGEGQIRFVKGQLSEDIEYCAQLLLKPAAFAVYPHNFYVYRQGRGSSITANITRTNVVDIANVVSRFSIKYKDDTDALPLLNYIALQYVLLMTVTTLVSKHDIVDVLSDMKRLWWLIKYDWCPYVRRVNFFRYLGFDITRLMLGLYKKIK